VAKNDVSLEGVLSNRTVIPKWKAPEKAIERDQPNDLILNRRKAALDKWHQKLLSTYKQAPSTYSANELFELSTIYQGDTKLSKDILKDSLNLRNKFNLPKNEMKVSEPQISYLEVEDSLEATHDNSKKSVNKLKALLRNNPNVPFAWSELSRHYLVLGEPDKAKKSMQGAIQLAKNNRYIQRAATRLFVHLREPDRALHLLRSSPMVSKDPWLLSAEIATASQMNKTSTFISSARNILNSEQFGDYQKSELASALGTLEIEHGVTKKAKELFKKSLIAPTENSLAQAQWANNEGKIIIPDNAWRTQSYEALTLIARQEGRWEDTLKECALWLKDEPYSIQAAILGSYLAFQPGAYRSAEQFATAGLLSENNNCDSINVMLLNNRAVAFSFQNKLEDAYADFEKAMALPDAKESAHLLATLGLIAYKNGDMELGTECYLKSIAWFHELKDKDSALLASMYFLREYIKYYPSETPFALKMAKKAGLSASVHNLPELGALSDLLIKETENIVLNIKSVSVISTSDLTDHANKFQVPNKALIRMSADKDPAKFLNLFVK